MAEARDEAEGLKVVAISPLDFFDDYTLAITDWMGRDSYDATIADKVERYTEAFAAVSRHPYWDGRLRCLPRVGYNPAEDEGYFIFKIDNNGTTFLVGRTLPPVDEEMGIFIGGHPNAAGGAA